jgi:anti-sigma factor RsiW
MTPERFTHLADAYGADLHRWPATERASARALLAEGNPELVEALNEARWLDGLLDSHKVPAPTPELIRRIVASAPMAAPSFWGRHPGWLSRLGFVGAGLAGMAAGMLVVSLSLPLPSASETLPSIFEQSDADIVLSINAEESDQ